MFDPLSVLRFAELARRAALPAIPKGSPLSIYDDPPQNQHPEPTFGRVKVACSCAFVADGGEIVDDPTEKPGEREPLVTVKTGVDIKNSGNLSQRDAIQIGVRCPNAKVIQLVDRVVLDGDKLVSRELVAPDQSRYVSTNDVNDPLWRVDTSQKDPGPGCKKEELRNPAYGSRDPGTKGPAPVCVTKKGMIMWDAPATKANGEPSMARFKSYAMCGNKVVKEITWSRSPLPDGTSVYRVLIQNPASTSLPGWVTNLLSSNNYSLP